MLIALLAAVLVSAVSGGYFPPALFGRPILAKAVSLDVADFRGEPVYRIEYQVMTDEGEVQSGFIHRQYSEFQKFDAMIPW